MIKLWPIIFINLIVGCSMNSNSTQEELEEEIKVPDQESWDVTFKATENGKVTAKLWFNHISQFNERKEYEFDQKFRVDFYNKIGEKTSWLTGERGKLKEDRTLMEAHGNVIAHSDSADITLFTESLFWDNIKKKILSNDFVMIVTEQDTIYGNGFEAETDFSKWEIKKSRGHTKRQVEIGIK